MKNRLELRQFAKLTKINVAERLVYGTLCEEVPDKAGEIFDYASSVPYFKAWNEQFAGAIAADGIPSVGNLRAMHGKVAAGKFVQMEYDDVGKKITVCSKVVDDNEWAKVESGVYTGFSIGGKYVKVWQDGDYIRYTAKPSEGSLVDNPCMYGATFSAIKGEGLEEVVKFVGSQETVEKGLYEVQDLAGCLRSLNSCRRWIMYETSSEKDGSTVAAQLKNMVTQLGQILVQYVAEEVSELTAGEEELEMAMNEQELKKLFAETLAPVVESIGELNKAVADIKGKKKAKPGVAAEETEEETADDAAKSADGVLAKSFATLEKTTNDRLTKFETGQAELKSGLEVLGKAFSDLAAGFEKYLSAPIPSNAALNGAGAVAVTKDADGTGKELNKDAKPEDVIKGIHAAGAEIRR